MNGEETNLVKKIMLSIGARIGVRVFRNNVGTAWIGSAKQFTRAQQVNVQPGDVLVQNARVFNGGLCKGSSDIIGFKSVEVSQEMVGKKLAVFMACEVKTAKGVASPEQIAFVDMVNRFGGIAFIARNEEEAQSMLENLLINQTK